MWPNQLSIMGRGSWGTKGTPAARVALPVLHPAWCALHAVLLLYMLRDASHILILDPALLHMGSVWWLSLGLGFSLKLWLAHVAGHALLAVQYTIPLSGLCYAVCYPWLCCAACQSIVGAVLCSVLFLAVSCSLPFHCQGCAVQFAPLAVLCSLPFCCWGCAVECATPGCFLQPAIPLLGSPLFSVLIPVSCSLPFQHRGCAVQCATVAVLCSLLFYCWGCAVQCATVAVLCSLPFYS